MQSWPEILPVGALATPRMPTLGGERLDWLQFEVTEPDEDSLEIRPADASMVELVEEMEVLVEEDPHPMKPVFQHPVPRAEGQGSGGHRFLRYLGRGSMGVVALVRHHRLQRDVAVKVARHGHSDARRRLIREARALAALRHPNIVTVHEIGANERTAWVTMEYVPGPTLWEEIRREGRMPVERAIDIAEQMASALGHAHVHGLVHRDVKPGNIVLSRDSWGEDRPVLLDFGIVKATGTVGRDWTDLTHDGVVGTLAYMPPEQLIGDPVGPEADVFSLGVLLFTMVTGIRPHVAAGGFGAAALLDAVPDLYGADEDPRLAALQELIGALMARQPQDRPAGGCEAAARIAAYRERWLTPPEPRQAEGQAMPFLLGLFVSFGLTLPVVWLMAAVPLMLWMGRS